MSFEEDDEVVLHDKHSEYDGQRGTVTQVVETMFGDATYTVSFEDGREQGVPEDSLEAVEAPASEDGAGEGEAGEGEASEGEASEGEASEGEASEDAPTEDEA